MWNRIAGLVIAAVAISAGAASAQYNTPATPAAPSAPSAPSITPAPGAPGGAVTLPFAINVAVVAAGTGQRVILTDAHGMTLYYLRNETSLLPRCMGRCTAVWPPALVSGGATFDPALSPVAIVNNINGPQLAYHGHLLYRFSKDMAPGQVNGDGIVDRWGRWAAAAPGVYYQP